MSTQPTLQTSRLTLRPFVLADAPMVRELAGAREIAETTLLIPHPYPEGVAERWIDTHAADWEKRTAATYAITERADGALVGAIGLSITAVHARGELGYWVAVPKWNRGYCTEAGTAILAFSFGALALHRVEARHYTRNRASGRVLEKLGMKLEGIHREAVRKMDGFEDLALYAILDREWAARRRSPENGSPIGRS